MGFRSGALTLGAFLAWVFGVCKVLMGGAHHWPSDLPQHERSVVGVLEVRCVGPDDEHVDLPWPPI